MYENLRVCSNRKEIDGIMKFNDIKCALLDCINLSVQLIFRCVGGFGEKCFVCRFVCEMVIDGFIDANMIFPAVIPLGIR